MNSLSQIKIIVLDVDGTMTDGGIYIDENKIEMKKFNVRDGAAILLAEKAGINFILLTGRKSNNVEQRANELKIKEVYQGIKNKHDFLKEYMFINNINKNEIAYIGDDLNDLFAMRLCGICICPNDAAPEIKDCCNFILNSKGGEGAVREFVEILLKECNEWDNAIKELFLNN